MKLETIDKEGAALLMPQDEKARRRSQYRAKRQARNHGGGTRARGDLGATPITARARASVSNANHNPRAIPACFPALRGLQAIDAKR
jgi:hypothetical protein